MNGYFGFCCEKKQQYKETGPQGPTIMGLLENILAQMRQASASFTSFLLNYRPEFNSARSHFTPILLLASVQRHFIVVSLAKTGQLIINLGSLFGSIPRLYGLISPWFYLARRQNARCT
jgi:hypothetical protein